MKRFNALHRFCKENGYGYIITDDRFHSIYDIKNSKINDDLSEALFQVLDKFGGIGWKDVQRLKKSFEITNITLASFIIQNKLKFTLSPFVVVRACGITNKTEVEILPKTQMAEVRSDLPNSEESNKKNQYDNLPAKVDGHCTVKTGRYNLICNGDGEILTNTELFEELRQLRSELADAEGVPRFYVFWDTQLISLSSYKPTNEQEWVAIKGLGTGKFKKYGKQVIEIIKKYINS